MNLGVSHGTRTRYSRIHSPTRHQFRLGHHRNFADRSRLTDRQVVILRVDAFAIPAHNYSISQPVKLVKHYLDFL